MIGEYTLWMLDWKNTFNPYVGPFELNYIEHQYIENSFAKHYIIFCFHWFSFTFSLCLTYGKFYFPLILLPKCGFNCCDFSIRGFHTNIGHRMETQLRGQLPALPGAFSFHNSCLFIVKKMSVWNSTGITTCLLRDRLKGIEFRKTMFCWLTYCVHRMCGSHIDYHLFIIRFLQIRYEFREDILFITFISL